MLTNTSGDQLRVLGAEIDHEHGLPGAHGPIVVALATPLPIRWVRVTRACHHGCVTWVRRILVCAIVSVAPLGAVASNASATTPPPAPPVTNDFMDLERDVSECISAMPKPGCGREPTSSGDRGGAMQIALFGIILVAMAGIGTRIAFAVRARDRVEDVEKAD